MSKFLIFTDGSYERKSHDGAWAYAVIDFESREIVKQDFGYLNSQGKELSTANSFKKVWKKTLDAVHLEIMACKEALKVIEPEHTYIICTDSINNVELFNDIKMGRDNLFHNRKSLINLGEELREFFIQNASSLYISFQKIKAHSGNCYNNYVDNIAKKVRLGKGDISIENSHDRFQKMKEMVFKNSYDRFWTADNIQHYQNIFDGLKQPITVAPKGSFVPQLNEKEDLRPSKYNGPGLVQLMNYKGTRREKLVELAEKEQILIKEFIKGKIGIFYKGSQMFYYPDKINEPITYNNISHLNQPIEELVKTMKDNYKKALTKKIRV